MGGVGLLGAGVGWGSVAALVSGFLAIGVGAIFLPIGLAGIDSGGVLIHKGRQKLNGEANKKPAYEGS